ncbi:HEAT repeat domain-containing protein [Haladaptatus sp. GCM10025707]|uniref:HEAT repeat domain-containing protein n=1 Tax=unclassified Haladaptatus TaxID=2622732 RepID=UPI0023E769EB|nr:MULTISPECIES: HEAT repeat domain-containing protein [unclassified Haladaptatus]
MSNGDEEPETPAEDAPAVTPESFEERLAEVEESLDEAETESDLDEIEARLDALETDLGAAELPEPEDDDEDDPREELESKLSDLRDALEDARGPYAEDVVSEIEAAKTKIEEGEWTEKGDDEVVTAAGSYADRMGEILDASFVVASDSHYDVLNTLDEIAEAVEAANLDADEDEETIAALVEATEEFKQDLEDAQEWDDLTVVEKLDAQGFYDVLTPKNRKDYPPELNAVRIYEKENNPEMILLALDMLESNFMQEHCIEALGRMGSPEAYDAMIGPAQKRKKPQIEVLGKIGNPDALETLLEYVEADNDPQLQKVTMKALGEIGDEEATQVIANNLVAENEGVRSQAARALGLLGDTRAVEPLGDVLDDDESDTVRASAAWALNQIGTKAALEEAARYDEDASYILQVEAEKASAALKQTTEPAA